MSISIEERIAILEAKLDRNERDITSLFDFMREHMRKEEEDRELLLKQIHSINEKLSNQRSFWGGIVFAISVLSALISAGLVWIAKLKF